MIKNHQGQILGEVVVAIGVIMLVLVGMSSLMSRNTKTIRQNDTKDIASRLVEAKIRDYRLQRDLDVNAFFENIATQPRDTFQPCSWSGATPTDYLVQVDCEVMYQDNVGGNGIGITVRGVWTEELPDDREVSLSVSIMN